MLKKARVLIQAPSQQGNLSHRALLVFSHKGDMNITQMLCKWYKHDTEVV